MLKRILGKTKPVAAAAVAAAAGPGAVGAAAAAQTGDGGPTQAARTQAQVTPPAPPTDPSVAQWAHPWGLTRSLEKNSTELEIAVGELAKDAVKVVKGYLGGGFAGLLVHVDDTLESQVMSMSWSSDECSEREAAVLYEESTGHLAVLIIEQQSSSKDVKVPYFGAKTHTAKLKYRFKRMQAKNPAAQEICQTLVNLHANTLLDSAKGDLVQHIEANEDLHRLESDGKVKRR